MLTIDIADKLRLAFCASVRRWRDLPAKEKEPWLRQAQLVESWIAEASSAAEGELDYD